MRAGAQRWLLAWHWHLQPPQPRAAYYLYTSVRGPVLLCYLDCLRQVLCTHCILTRALLCSRQEYKAANTRIEAICRSVAELSLVAVDRKRTYDVEEFETLQMEHHAQVGGLWSVTALFISGQATTHRPGMNVPQTAFQPHPTHPHNQP